MAYDAGVFLQFISIRPLGQAGYATLLKRQKVLDNVSQYIGCVNSKPQRNLSFKIGC